MSELYPPLRVGAPLGSGYTVARFLGIGTIGHAYEVRDQQGRRLVAKTRPCAADYASEEAFRDIVVQLSRASVLDGRRVVPILDAGLDLELRVQFVVVPFLNGCSLEDLVEKIGPLHPVAAVRLAMQACEGLRDAHSKGLMHGDVKPSNLFLDHLSGGEVSVRLSDFGLTDWARYQRSLADTGSIPPAAAIPPVFSSPEQVFDQAKPDERTDVWGIAMTLYFALSGLPTRRQLSEVDARTALSEIPNIQDVAAWIPPELANVIHGALIRERDLRCPSIDAWMKALEPFEGGNRELTTTKLSPVPIEVSRNVAPRADRPVRWQAIRLGGGSDVLPGLDIDPLTGSTIGEYRLESLIGRGGMGAVYRAAGPDGNPVAIKVLQETAASKPGSLHRLVREAKTMTKISSPYVVQIIEAGTDPDMHRPYIVMELLRGTDLERYILRWGALDPAPVVSLFIHVCGGLEAAHATNVIHRDIKPSNIFIHETDNGTVQPKLFDFGVAKLVTAGGDVSALTRTGHIMGSPRYMSPEHAQNAKNIDGRSDIWSLGVSLYEALSGVNPWQQYNTVGELLIAICTRRVPPLRDYAPWVEPGLASVVHRCLRQEPDERFQSATELAAALAPFASKQPVAASSLSGVSTARLASSTSGAAEKLVVSKARRTGDRRWWVVAAAVLAFSIAAAVSAMKRGRAGVSPDVSTSAASSAVSEVAVRPEASRPTLEPAPPASVRLRITAFPSVVRVLLDDRPLPTNPFEKTWAADGSEHVIRAEAPGYVAVERTIRANQDVDLVLELRQEPRRTPGSGTTTSTPATATAVTPPKPDCNPPYYLDERGVKKFKPGCI